MRPYAPLLALALLSLTALPTLAGHELDNRDLVSGAQVYAENCAACHGDRLQGQPNWQQPDANGMMPAPPHDASGHTWHHSNQQNFDYTKQGGAEIIKRLGVQGFTSGMPRFAETLTDDQIWDVLAYIQSQWPADIQEVQKGRNPPHN